MEIFSKKRGVINFMATIKELGREGHTKIRLPSWPDYVYLKISFSQEEGKPFYLAPWGSVEVSGRESLGEGKPVMLLNLGGSDWEVFELPSTPGILKKGERKA